MTSTSQIIHVPRFATAIAVEAFKLRRSLALLLAAVAPLLIAIFLFFSLLRLERAMPWNVTLQSSAALWASFMLPMSVTALTALVAHAEHGPHTWDHLRALPLPRWHLYAAKAVCVLGIIVIMSMVLALLMSLTVPMVGWLKPAVAATGPMDFAAYLLLLGRMFLAAWLLVVLQLWIALRYSSFVPGLVIGIGGTFFAVVASSARIGVVLPWQIPINQLAEDPARAQLALALGFIGGCLMLAVMVWHMSNHEVPGN